MMKYRIREIGLLFDGPHATPQPSASGPVFLGIKNFTEDGGLDLSDTRYISWDEYPRWTKRVTPQKGDIVFTYEATLHRYAIIPDNLECCLGRRVALLRVNPEIADNRFVYYYFLSCQWRDFINNNLLIGSTVDRISIEEFPRYEIDLPDLPTQKAIASILSSLDDKIELNNRINKTLEEMAQAIFRRWFVDFEFPDENGNPYKSSGGEMVESEMGLIPKGWIALPIEAVADRVAMGPFGSNIKVETFVESGVPIISGTHLRGLYLDESGYNFITEDHARRLSNSLVYAGDIIFTHAGNIGQVALIPDDCEYPCYVISQRQFYLRCDKQKALPEYINYYFHNREGQGKLLANTSQTGVPSIARPSSHLKSIVVPVPPIAVQSKWLYAIKPMLQTLNSNRKESKRLALVRDVLLPRLLSGELSMTRFGGADFP